LNTGGVNNVLLNSGGVLQNNLLYLQNLAYVQSIVQHQQNQTLYKNKPLIVSRTPSSLGSLPSKRKWTLKILNKNKVKTDLQVDINIKIRGEEASCFVPDKLYSSHKYVIEYIVKGGSDAFSLIVSKLKVIKPGTSDEIMREEKIIVKGSIESALTIKNRGLEGTMRIQFTSNSYHHGKGFFLFKSYFLWSSRFSKPNFYNGITIFSSICKKAKYRTWNTST